MKKNKMEKLIRKLIKKANEEVRIKDEENRRLLNEIVHYRKEIEEEKTQKQIWIERCKQIKAEKQKREYDVKCEGGYW